MSARAEVSVRVEVKGVCKCKGADERNDCHRPILSRPQNTQNNIKYTYPGVPTSFRTDDQCFEATDCVLTASEWEGREPLALSLSPTGKA